jgi:hypothetical protein
MARTRFLATCAVLLTLTLCLGDQFFHVRTGILEYHWTPLVYGQSVWVWPIFAAGATAMVLVGTVFPVTDTGLTHVPWIPIFGTSGVVVLVYFLSGQFGNTHPNEFFWAAFAVWLGRLAFQRTDRLPVVWMSLTLAVLGVVTEGLFSTAGLFVYQVRQILGWPWWLSTLYLHGGFSLLYVTRAARLLTRPAG